MIKPLIVYMYMHVVVFSCVLKARREAHGRELDGRHIRVDFSITDRAHTPTPGVYLGNPKGRTSGGARGGRAGGGGPAWTAPPGGGGGPTGPPPPPR